MCIKFVEETTKSSVAISSHFTIIYGRETFLTPCPNLFYTIKEAFSKVHIIKNILEND